MPFPISILRVSFELWLRMQRVAVSIKREHDGWEAGARGASRCPPPFVDEQRHRAVDLKVLPPRFVQGPKESAADPASPLHVGELQHIFVREREPFECRKHDGIQSGGIASRLLLVLFPDSRFLHDHPM